MKTCLERLPWRKALLTSNSRICQHLFKASVSINFIVCGLTTSVKVYLKSTPRHWVNLFATRPALYLSIEPSRLCLIQNIYLHAMILWCLGGGTSDHVPFRLRVSNSSKIAFLQCVCCITSLTIDGSRFLGSGCLNTLKAPLGLKILFWEWVIVGWFLCELRFST